MAFGAGGGRRRQRFSAFMATFFLVSLLGFSNWEEKRRAGRSSPLAAVIETEEEAGARRSGPGLAGRRLRGTGRRGWVREPRRPAGRTRSPAAGQGRGLAVSVSGTGVSDTATDTRLWAEAEKLLEWRRVAKQHLEEPGWTLYMVEMWK